MIDRRRLSKTLSHALRHDPDTYGIDLDPEGWARIDEVVAALRDHRRSWGELETTDLRELVARSDKPRFELDEDRIRARYGHSISRRPRHGARRPPQTLYHGTTRDAARRIVEEGLRPMSRERVHLSTDAETARTVGRRRAREPVVLRIRARSAHRDGVAFTRAAEGVWLSGPVPPEYVDVPDTPQPGDDPR